MKKKTVLFLLGIFLSILAPALQKPYGEKVCEYHVSSSGNDANPGTLSMPWLTVQHAADSVSPGDTVFIHEGTYEEEVVLRYSGTAVDPITFSAARDESVTVEGLEFAAGAAYMNIINMKIEGRSIWRVWIRGGNHHITLKGLTIIRGETGVRITWGYSGQPSVDGPVSDIILEDCLIQGQMYTAVDCTPGPGNRMVFRDLEIIGPVTEGEPMFGADGIAVERGNNLRVENCYIHDIMGDGIDLNSRDTSGHSIGIEVKGNIIARAHRSGIKLWAGGRIENNIVKGSGIAPLVIGIFPSSYELVNNTIAFNMWNPGYSGRDYSLVAAYPSEGISPDVDLVLSNNIFAFNTGPQVGTPTGIYLGEGVRLVSEGNNIFWSREDCEITAEFVHGDPDFSRSEINAGAWIKATGQGFSNMTKDPLFVRGWPDIDLHLFETSPAIDAGTPDKAPSDDCEGRLRPAGNGYDIGAYEYGSVLGGDGKEDDSKDRGSGRKKRGKRMR